jgi:hypothetical protein
MKLEGTRSPRQGPRKCQLLATPWVALSLSMIALGGSGLSGGFRLITLSVGRTLDNQWDHFGYGYCIPRCRGRII